jgi:hypothetical protein
MRILGPPSGTRETVLSNLPSLGAAPLFTQQMFPALWSAAVKYATFEELGGKWAPSASYGTEIVQIAEQLRA